ncbi:NAD(P)-dependent oxidoreductase [Paenibacillus massiliensis]|uniref:NAD(P)-dependent oxidoreductase n=1 Tax=Paenibacillus massiliensis TaxID=225917 RepID=UPI0004722434|nr:NAD(P)H-binding protein [Paenibacillus massiliensis]
MKIAVIGATGGTGKKVIERALGLGHEVIAVARRPEAISSTEGLTVRKGDVFDLPVMIQAISGAEAVISCIGPPLNVSSTSANKGLGNLSASLRTIKANFSPGTVMSEGIPNIITACQRTGVKRIVMQSGINLSDGGELSYVSSLAVRLMRRIFWKAIQDKSIAEQALIQSDLEWVIVRASVLQYAEGNLKYTAGPLARINPLGALPFADCADGLVRAAASQPDWTGKIVNIGR